MSKPSFHYQGHRHTPGSVRLVSCSNSSRCVSAAWHYVSILTEPRIEHVKCHLITFRRSSDSHEPLVAVVLRFVDLDHAAAELPDLIDLGSTFTDNCPHHVIRDKDLLCQRLTRHHSLNGLCWWSSMAMRGLVTSVWNRLMGSSASITMLRGSPKMRGCLWCLLLLRCLPVEVWDTVRIGWRALRLVVMALEVIWVTIVSSSRLRHVRDDLHTSWHNASWSSATGSVGRCCRPAKTLRQLFHKCLPYVVRSDVNSIRDS